MIIHRVYLLPHPEWRECRYYSSLNLKYQNLCCLVIETQKEYVESLLSLTNHCFRILLFMEWSLVETVSSILYFRSRPRLAQSSKRTTRRVWDSSCSPWTRTIPGCINLPAYSSGIVLHLALYNVWCRFMIYGFMFLFSSLQIKFLWFCHRSIHSTGMY